LIQKCLIFIGSLFLSANLFAQKLSIYCEDVKPAQYIGVDGKLSGFAVEIVQEIQRRVGNNDPIQMVPWARGLEILKHEPNSLLFSMARTAERNSQYQWIGPISETTYGLYVKADSKLKINNLNDAKRAGLIGVYRGDARDQILTQLGFDNLDRANSTIFSFRKLMIGRVAMYADAPLALKSLAESEGYKSSDVRLAYTFYRAQLYIATSKETDPAIVAQWNKALEQMKKESVFQNIYRNNYPNIDPPGPTITKFE
jgi:polar amino acid transport system substrate-binding protein